MVSCLRAFISLIRDTWVEDELHALVYEPSNMAVYQLGRITLRLTWNGLNAQFVDLSGRLWGKCYMVA